MTDHRIRVGRQRSAQTRRQIAGVALGVFADKGPDAPVIDDFIRAAGVARGTFYNHFSNTAELLEEATQLLEDTVMRWTLASINEIDDPALRLATGVRLWLRWARQDPIGCGFVVRSRFRGPLVERQLKADLRAGRADGIFRFATVDTARDLVIGTILEAMSRMTRSRVSRTFTDDIARLILQGLGTDKRTLDRFMGRKLPALDLPAWSAAPARAPSSRG